MPDFFLLSSFFFLIFSLCFTLLFFSFFSPVLQARKLSDFDKAVKALTQVLGRGTADAVVLQSLQQMTQMIAGRDFVGALSVHRSLTQSSWEAHKEWLKPLKNGLDIAKRNIR